MYALHPLNKYEMAIEAFKTKPSAADHADFEPFTEGEFWHYQMIFTGGPQFVMGYIRFDDGQQGWARAYFNDQNGFWMIVVRSEKYIDGKSVPSVKYYKWSKCKHEFVGRSVGRCITEYTCKHCGYRTTVDSSD